MHVNSIASMQCQSYIIITKVLDFKFLSQSSWAKSSSKKTTNPIELSKTLEVILHKNQIELILEKYVFSSSQCKINICSIDLDYALQTFINTVL